MSAVAPKKLDPMQKKVARAEQVSASNYATLSEGFRLYIDTIFLHLRKKGWRPVIAEAKRTKEQQAKKVKKGYSQTMKSFHVVGNAIPKHKNALYWDVKGEAVDIVDARYGWHGPAADVNYQFWKDLGALAKKLGLTWGGDFTKTDEKTGKRVAWPDVAHVEMKYLEFDQDIRNPKAGRTA